MKLEEIEACSKALRETAGQRGALKIYRADCLQICDATDALVAELRLWRDLAENNRKAICNCYADQWTGVHLCDLHRLTERADRKLGEP